MDRDKIEEGVRLILEGVGEDVGREGLRGHASPRRRHVRGDLRRSGLGPGRALLRDLQRGPPGDGARARHPAVLGVRAPSGAVHGSRARRLHPRQVRAHLRAVQARARRRRLRQAAAGPGAHDLPDRRHDRRAPRSGGRDRRHRGRAPVHVDARRQEARLRDDHERRAWHLRAQRRDARRGDVAHHRPQPRDERAYGGAAVSSSRSSARWSWASSTSRPTPSPTAASTTIPRAAVDLGRAAHRRGRVDPRRRRRVDRPGRRAAVPVAAELARVRPVVRPLRRRPACRSRSTRVTPRSPRRASTPERASSTTSRASATARWSRSPRDATPVSSSCTCSASRGPCRATRATTTWSARSAATCSRRRRSSRPPGSPVIASLSIPDIGFGKTARAQPRAAPPACPRLVELGYPVVVGVSRKRFIGDITGVRRASRASRWFDRRGVVGGRTRRRGRARARCRSDRAGACRDGGRSRDRRRCWARRNPAGFAPFADPCQPHGGLVSSAPADSS